MKEKFLPIGTVCSLLSKNKKIMITGFLGITYNGNVKMYDYIGCEYPEGLLLQNKTYMFNHEDIQKIEHMGLESQEHITLKNNLLKNNVSEDKIEPNGVFNNFKFDENGVVIFDGTVTNTAEVFEEKKDVVNPFNQIYMKPITPKDSNNTIFNRFKFDKNGVVIADNTVSEVQTASGYQFDENGIVISDGSTSEAQATSGYQFDENGVVISDGSTPEAQTTSGYQFDENGVVISDGSTPEAQATSGYQFDENGVVIAE